MRRALLILPVLLLPACVQRRIVVTSDPPGALVWLNDREIGRTPAEAGFRYHGDYDVRLELPGYQPVHTERRAKAPVYEYPGIDLVAIALPVRFKNEIRWHFDLEPTPEASLPPAQVESELIERADELRAQAITPDTAPAESD